MLLTLIQTSQNRKKELARFIESVNKQKNVDFSRLQLIFIDQGDNESVFCQLNPSIKFTYVKTNRCSLSHARNIGLPLVEGKYVCFPDDDCWYEPDTLCRALSVLDNENCQGVSGLGANEEGKLTSVFPNKDAVLTNVKRCGAISYTLFFVYSEGVFFDENIGVGSPYNLGAGEETDYLLTLMENKNYKVLYKKDLIIHHPIQEDVYDQSFLLKKFYSYSRGAGFLMKKHRFPIRYKIEQFGRPLVGMFFYLLKGDLFRSKKSFFMLKGKIEGIRFNIPAQGGKQ